MLPNGMNLTTPTILFSAITLIMLAHTNRFFALGKLIRDVHAHRTGESQELNLKQIPTLKRRLTLTKWMQALGVFSFILCTASLLSLVFGLGGLGQILFLVSVFALMCSLIVSLWEVMISTHALDLVLEDCTENHPGTKALSEEG